MPEAVPKIAIFVDLNTMISMINVAATLYPQTTDIRAQTYTLTWNFIQFYSMSISFAC